MKLSYKQCSIDNHETLILVSRKTFIDAFERQNNPEDFKQYMRQAFDKNEIKNQLLDKNMIFYLVYTMHDLVGYFKLNKNEAQKEKFKNSCVELERFYVLKTFQNQGIGALMLLKVLNIARQYGGDFLWLGVWQKNKDAIRFYELQGFKKFESHPYFIGKDQQIDWIMKKNFNS